MVPRSETCYESNGDVDKKPVIFKNAPLGSIHNLSRGWAMMISLFFPFIFLKPPLSSQGFFSDPPSRDVDLSKENIIAPPPPAHKYNNVKLTLSHIKVL